MKRSLDTTDFDAFDYYDEAGTFLGSNSVSSLASKRRNMRRRMSKGLKRGQSLQHLQEEFDWIRVVDKEPCARTIRLAPAFSDLDPLFKEFMEQEPGLIPQHADPRQRCFCQPNDLAQMHHLKYFDRPEGALNEAYRSSYEKAKKVVRAIIDTGERIPFPHLEALQDVPYAPSKFPGYEYAREGYKTRAEANARAQVDAEEAFVKLLDGERVEPHYVRLGGRGKVVNKTREEAEQENLAKGRLILMLSQRELKLLGVTEKPLTAYMKEEDCPVYVGNSWFMGGVTHFARVVRPFEKLFAFDAEKFDSSIDPYLVHDAVNLCRSLFEDGMAERYDAYWAFVEETLLAAPIVRDDGFVFYKTVGTTSGHSHNTLLQSIITLTIGYTAVCHLAPDLALVDVYRKTLLLALGDDNLLGVSGPLAERTVEDFGDVVYDAFRIKWHGVKSFATGRAWDPLDQRDPLGEGGEFEGVQFLGKYLRRLDVNDQSGQIKAVIPYRPLSETIARVAYPERAPRPSALAQYSPGQLAYLRALGNYLDAAGNDRTRVILDRYLDFLERKGYRAIAKMEGKEEWKFFGAGHRKGSKKMELRRFTYDEWLDLVLCERKQVMERTDPL